MARLPEETIELIRQSVDIVDVVSEFVTLNKRGKNFMGLCPFHDDHSPSMNVSQEKQIYKCFSCGAGGNVYTFLTELEKISFVEAVRKLAEQANIPLPEDQPEDRGKQEVYDALYGANELALKYFKHMLLTDPAGESAREYLKSRGVTENVIEHFSLGYAPNTWEGFLQVAGRRSFSAKVLEQAGLVLPKKDGRGFYDRFRHRIMFPIVSHTGRTVAFGARALDPNDQAKYLNSPETPIYHKGSILYGLWGNRDALRTSGTAIVVEGYMDLIALGQADIHNTVASAGTALTPDHARLLKRYTEHTVLVFDGDAAGTSAAARGIGSLFEAGMETRVVTLDEGQDPDSFVRQHGPKAFLKLTENARPVIDFLLDWIRTREDLTTSDGKARAVESIAELLVRIKDEALRHFVIQETAQKLGTDESTVIQVIQRAGRTARRRPSPSTSQNQFTFDPAPRLERELLIYMMTGDNIADSVLREIKPEDFSNSVYRRIASLIEKTRSENQSPEVAVLLGRCKEEDLSHVLSSLSMEMGILNPDQSEAPIKDYIKKFRLKNLDTNINSLEGKLRSQDHSEDLKALMKKHRDLTEQRKNLLESGDSLAPSPAP
jgi:DNA primase